MSDDDSPVNWFNSDRPYREAKVIPLKPKKKRLEGWKSEWHLSDSGVPLPTLFNVMVALRNHPGLCNLVRFDEMSRSTTLLAQIPNTPPDPSIPRELRDDDVLAIQEEIQLTGLRRIAKATVQDALDLRASQDRFHPIKEYLDGLVWDGETRVDGWLSRYLGVEGGPYPDKIGRLFLIALCARVFKPGCKADYMLILEGPQGALKSSACQALVGGKWFSDNLPDLSKGDAVRRSMHLRGKWLIEIAEMSSFNAAEAHTLKEFLTQTEERYIPKFGRKEVKEPRQCLFIGSTNERTYLRDATGARRFWPVVVGEILLEALKADRDQLLAEAVMLFKAGEPWWPDREFEVTHVAPQQDARFEHDAWEEDISRWLERNNVHKCTVSEIGKDALYLSVGMIGTSHQRRISAILKRLGWVPKRSENGRFFHRPDFLSD